MSWKIKLCEIFENIDNLVVKEKKIKFFILVV